MALAGLTLQGELPGDVGLRSALGPRVFETRSITPLRFVSVDALGRITEVLFETMGFGKPMDHMPILLMPGVLSLAWGGTVRLLADGLGVTLDEIREQYEKRAADETFTTKPGTVEKGTMAGLRFEVQGIVNGRPAIVLEHVTRLHDDIAPGSLMPSCSIWPFLLSL